MASGSIGGFPRLEGVEKDYDDEVRRGEKTFVNHQKDRSRFNQITIRR